MSGRSWPAFVEESRGEVRLLKAIRQVEIVDPTGMLTGPRGAGAEPSQSTTNSPPAIVTVTWSGIGPSVIPSPSIQSQAVHEPSGIAASARRAVRSPWSRIASTHASTVGRPNFASSSPNRRSPVRSAAICAFRSPSTASGMRELKRIRSSSSRSGRPALTSFVPGKISPSWCMSVESSTYPRILRTQVEPVGPHDQKRNRQRPRLVEHGREQGRVVGVGAAPVRVVEHDYVALPEVLAADEVDALADRVVVGPDEARHAGCLGDGLRAGRRRRRSRSRAPRRSRG